MCESGKQCYEGENCGARMVQLRRLILVLVVWVSILTLGLSASVTLHFVHSQMAPGTSSASTDSKLTSYACIIKKKESSEMNLQWQKIPEGQGDALVKVEEDGNYFFYLQVTIESLGKNYTVRAEKVPKGNKPLKILEGHINGSQKSTGFMGIGLHLTAETVINVTCSQWAQLDVQNTYLGMIKL